MRSPLARLSAILSRIILTASSASLATSCGNCAARRSISSDLVIALRSPFASVLVLRVQLGLQQRPQIRRARGGARILRAHPLHRLALVGGVLRLDRKVDAPVLAIDVDDHRRD